MEDTAQSSFEDGRRPIFGADAVCTEFLARMNDPENIILMTQFETMLHRYEEAKRLIDAQPNGRVYIGCKYDHVPIFKDLETQYVPVFAVFLTRSLNGPIIECTTFDINKEKKITGVRP